MHHISFRRAAQLKSAASHPEAGEVGRGEIGGGEAGRGKIGIDRLQQEPSLLDTNGFQTCIPIEDQGSGSVLLQAVCARDGSGEDTGGAFMSNIDGSKLRKLEATIGSRVFTHILQSSPIEEEVGTGCIRGTKAANDSTIRQGLGTQDTFANVSATREIIGAAESQHAGSELLNARGGRESHRGALSREEMVGADLNVIVVENERDGGPDGNARPNNGHADVKIGGRNRAQTSISSGTWNRDTEDAAAVAICEGSRPYDDGTTIGETERRPCGIDAVVLAQEDGVPIRIYAGNGCSNIDAGTGHCHPHQQVTRSGKARYHVTSRTGKPAGSGNHGAIGDPGTDDQRSQFIVLMDEEILQIALPAHRELAIANDA